MRVLVLDDDEAIRSVIHTQLTEAGYEVFATSDPAEVMTDALRGKFDLIITELIMSSMTGLEFVGLLRGLGRMVPAVMITASLHGGVISGAEKIGFSHIIPKPFREGTVVRVARKVLGIQQPDPSVRA